MFEQQLQDLIERWKKVFGQYDSLKAEAEQSIFRLEWTTGERYSDLQFHFQRFPGRGRVLKETPIQAGNFFQYGFDKRGRVRLHRDFPYRPGTPSSFVQKPYVHTELNEALFSETFYQYSNDRVEIIEFSAFPPHIPLRVQQILFEYNRVKIYGNFRLNGYTPLYGKKGENPDHLYDWLGYNGRIRTVEEYHYDDERLKSIASYYEFPGIPPYTASEQLTYDETGKLKRIDRVFDNGRKQVIYQKRSKGQSFQAIREEATHKIIQAIVQRINAANIQETIYCIDLYYQQAIKHFPPYLTPVPERYRLELLQSGDPTAQFNIFCPIFNEWFLEIDDPETLEICQLLEQEIQTGEKWDIATRILRDVAAALTLYDWSGILNVTPDFVVFTLDPEMEGDHLVEVLSSSVPKKQIQEWIDKGWLP